MFQSNKIVIVPTEHQDSDARRMKVDQERRRGRHRLQFPTFENPNTHANSISTVYHLVIKTF